MRTRRTGALAAPLQRMRERLEGWRETRDRRAIPEGLWTAAVQLAAEHGIHRTARALRLNSQSLRRRVEATVGHGSPGKEAAASFWELAPPSARVRASGVGECIVEVEAADGRKLRVHWTGAAVPDLAALIGRVWSGRA